jgi:hypothetical protein
MYLRPSSTGPPHRSSATGPTGAVTQGRVEPLHSAACHKSRLQVEGIMISAEEWISNRVDRRLGNEIDHAADGGITRA